MSILKYDEYELLELFEKEPDSVFEDKACGVFMYDKTDSRGLNLLMVISEHEHQCDISLTTQHQNYDSPILDIDMHDVIEIKGTKEYLTIYRESERNVKIYFKPNFIIEFENF